MKDGTHDPFRRPSVPVRVNGVAHSIIGVCIGEECLRRIVNGILIRSYEGYGTRFYGFRPFRRITAKLLGSSLHWLRHTFAVASLEVMPVNVVQTAMGHASVNTTTRYISPDQTEVLEGFKKLKS